MMSVCLLLCVLALSSVASHHVSGRYPNDYAKEKLSSVTRVLGDSILWPEYVNIQYIDLSILPDDACQTKITIGQTEIKAIRPTEYSHCFPLLTCSCVHYFYGDGSYAVHHALSSVISGDPFSQEFKDAFEAAGLEFPDEKSKTRYADMKVVIQVAGYVSRSVLGDNLVGPLTKKQNEPLFENVENVEEKNIPEDNVFVFYGDHMASGYGVREGSVGEVACSRKKLLEMKGLVDPKPLAVKVESTFRRIVNSLFGKSKRLEGTLMQEIDTLDEDVSLITHSK